jgi:hypothetical protein
MTIYGPNDASIGDNIYQFPTLTAPGSTAAVEVNGLHLTFICVVTGGDITWEIEGSHDGTNWASLDPAKTKAVGSHADYYAGYVVRYVRVTTITQAAGRTLSVSMGVA